MGSGYVDPSYRFIGNYKGNMENMNSIINCICIECVQFCALEDVICEATAKEAPALLDRLQSLLHKEEVKNRKCSDRSVPGLRDLRPALRNIYYDDVLRLGLH